jgi:hypothetical protein
MTEKINLNLYANKVLNIYKKSILEVRKKIGYGSNQVLFDDIPIRAENCTDIKKLATKRGRSKIFWYGLIYEISEILPNQKSKPLYGGMTTLTLPERWHFAVRDSVEKPATWHLPLIKKIRDFLFIELGFNNDDLRDDWQKIHAILDRRFKRDVKILCFNDPSLRNEERTYIRENNLIDDGLNILEGGEGGPAIDLPMLQIAELIAMGYTITDIYKLIQNKYHIKCSLQTVRA